MKKDSFEIRLVQFLQNKKNIFFYGILIVFSIFMFGRKMFFSKKDKEFLEISKKYALWEKEKISFLDIEKFLNRGSLDLKYSSNILQKLIFKNDKNYKNLTKILDNKELSDYGDFSKISILISKEDKKALDLSYKLKEKIKDKNSFLYFCNLLRILSLEENKDKKHKIAEILKKSKKEHPLKIFKKEELFHSYLNA